VIWPSHGSGIARNKELEYMVSDLHALDSWFDSRAWPRVPCPRCGWRLTIDSASITEYESTESVRGAIFDLDIAEWHGRFYVQVTCDDEDCSERIIMAGVCRYIEDSDDPPDRKAPGRGLHSEYRLEYMSPPPRLMKLSSKVPETVEAGVVLAAKLMWIDPSAAINRLRATLEFLLDDLEVPRSRSLHNRISLLAAGNAYAAEILQAVKWAGNQGSHGLRDVTVKDVMETAELMQHAIDLLYDKSDLFRRAQLINQAKRIISKDRNQP
jgi:hypothetical protein